MTRRSGTGPWTHLPSCQTRTKTCSCMPWRACHCWLQRPTVLTGRRTATAAAFWNITPPDRPQRDNSELGCLRAAATQATDGTQAHTRRFAAYVERLLSYLTTQGPVKRTMADQMACDLLSSLSQ